MRKGSDNPMDWTNGQPKTEDENWQFIQRTEHLNLVHRLVCSMVQGHETFGTDSTPFDAALVDRCSQMVTRMIANSDRAFPRA